MYGLTPEDLELQARARGLRRRADPARAVRRGARRRAARGRRPPARGPGRRARPDRDQHPRPSWAAAAAARSSRCSSRSRAGRVTNALAWCLTTPPAWWAGRRQRPPARDLPDPDGRGPARGVLRHHRGVRRLRRLRPAGHRGPRRRRLRAQRREVARDVVQQVRLRLLPGRADHRGPRRRAGAVRRRQGHARASAWSAPRRTPTPSPTTTRSWRSRTSASRRPS